MTNNIEKTEHECEVSAVLPTHNGLLALTNNEHEVYGSVTEYMDFMRSCNLSLDDYWVSGEQKAKSIVTNEMWQIQWSTGTSVENYRLHRLIACDLDVLLKASRIRGEKSEDRYAC